MHAFCDIKTAKYLPIEVAALMGHREVVRFLLSRGAFPARALLFAAQAGQVEVVEDMIKANVVLELSVDGYTPLTGAIVHHRTAVVQLLLESGISVVRPISSVLARAYALPANSSVLHLAAHLGHGDVVSMLLHRHGDLRTRAAADGVTPFQASVD